MNSLEKINTITAYVKAGVWEYKLIEGVYEDSNVLYAELAAVGAGIANSINQTDFGLRFGFSADLFSIYYAGRELAETDPDDPLLLGKVAAFTTGLTSLLLSITEVIGKVPTPQARALAVAVGAASTLLEFAVAKYKVEIDQRALEENTMLQATIERIEQARLATVEHLESESSILFDDFSALYDPAKKKLDVLRDYEVKSGTAYQLLAKSESHWVLL